MKKELFIIFCLLIFLSSCTINGTLQGLFSYYNKTKKESSISFVRINSIKDSSILKSDSTIVLLANGTELNNCLQKYEKSVVYIWAPKCKSKYCYSLNLLQEICRQQEVELFIVAEYYDSYYMSKQYSISHNLIGIDVKYYRSNITSKYLSEFIFDLTNGAYKYDVKNNVYCNFLRFNNGEFVKAFMSIEDL
jgi:hypothetical protein